MRLKLFPKIALILIALATLPVLVVGLQTATLNREHLETNVLELHTNLVRSLSDRVDLYLNSVVHRTVAAIQSMRGQGFISAEQLQSIVEANDEFIGVSYLDPRGRELIKAVNPQLTSEKRLEDRSQSDVFLAYQNQPLAPGQSRGPKYAFYFQDREPRLAMVFPYGAGGSSHGAFYVAISLAKLWDQILTTGAGVQSGGREAFIVDEKGFVIAHSSATLMLNRASFRDNPIVAEALQGRTIGSKEFADESGHSMIGSYSRVRSSGWIAVIQQPKEAAFYAVYETRRRALQIVLVSILVASWVAFLFAGNISRPILALIEGAKRISRGDFSHKVAVKTSDEMSDLAYTFNEMTRELKRYNDLNVDRVIEEKTKTESVILSIEDGIILADAKGRIQLLNDSAATLLSQYSPGPGSPDGPAPAGAMEAARERQWVGCELAGLFSEPRLQEAFRELLAHPEAQPARELPFHSGPYERYYRLYSKPVFQPRSGKPMGVVTVLRDVTLERQMEELKESFLHSITHDLRNPMTSISGFIKFLMDGVGGPVTEAQKNMLVTMKKASARLLSMINDILDIAKVEAGKLEIDLQPLFILPMLEDVMALYRPLAERKSIQFNLSLPEGLSKESLVINADGNQVERVISNLVANALKYTLHEGRVDVVLEDFSDRLQIAVQDNGPGIPPDAVRTVFDKFQQVRGQRQGGTGLGLTICRHFVELHKGKIWVESQLEKGSRFTFWIPKDLTRSETGDVVSRKTSG